MTDEEKAIVMAYTGICMLTGDKFYIFHEYVERLMGRPIYTHELGLFADEIKGKTKDDFIKLCDKEEPYNIEQYPCEDCVSREQALEAMDTWDKFGYTEKGSIVRIPKMKGDYVPYVRYDDMVKCIKNLPAVKPQPKTGHWILDETDNSITCNRCGCLIWANDITNGEAYYCPNCGAEMGGENGQKI